MLESRGGDRQSFIPSYFKVHPGGELHVLDLYKKEVRFQVHVRLCFQFED